jgi:hypothetical protein
MLHVEKDGNWPHREYTGACRIYIDRVVDYMPCIQITYHIYTIPYYTYSNNPPPPQSMWEAVEWIDWIETHRREQSVSLWS